MASLTNNKIKETYQSLVKFNDNGNITTSAKRLTDGFGNNSPFFVSTTQIGIGVTPTLGFDLHVNQNAKIGGNLNVGGNLTVSGTLTYLDVEDLATEDPLIKLARNNVGNTLDIGFFGKYIESSVTKYKGIFADADDDKWHFFKGTSTEPTTVVDTAGTGYTKADIVIGAIDSTGGTFSGQITIPQTPTADGHAASKKYVDDHQSVEVAERVEITVKNVSGGSLAKGTVVHASPSATPPSGNVIEVIKADYDDATKMPAIGVLNETIANEGEGAAVMMGAVSGFDTSSFSIGDELYVGNDGAFTNTKPTATNQLVQKIAVVVKSHASNGLIKVFGAGRSNDVPNKVDRDITFSENVIIAQTNGDDRLRFTRSGHDTYDLTLRNSEGLGIYNATDGRTEMQFGGNGNIFIGDSTGTRRIILFGANSQTTSSELIFGDSNTQPAPEHAGIGLRYDSSNNQLSIRSFFDGDSSSARDVPIALFDRQTLQSTFYAQLNVEDANIKISGAGPVLYMDSTNNASGGRIIIQGLDQDGDDLFRIFDASNLRLNLKRDGRITNIGIIDTTLKIDTATNTQPLNISRHGSVVSETLQIGVTDTVAVFKYIEDTTSEGNGVFGSYQFKLGGNDGETDVTPLQLAKSNSTFNTDITLNNSYVFKSSNNPTSNFLDFDDDSTTHNPDVNTTTLASVSGIALATNLNDGGGGNFTISTGSGGTDYLQ